MRNNWFGSSRVAAVARAARLVDDAVRRLARVGQELPRALGAALAVALVAVVGGLAVAAPRRRQPGLKRGAVRGHAMPLELGGAALLLLSRGTWVLCLCAVVPTRRGLCALSLKTEWSRTHTRDRTARAGNR